MERSVRRAKTTDSDAWRRLRVGVDPWAPRATGCSWHHGYEACLSQSSVDEEGTRGYWGGPVCEVLDGELRHGDGVDNASYRGIGAYIVEQVDPYGTRFRFWKTWQEYGYTAPSVFCDVPYANYFDGGGVTGVLVWPPLLLDREAATAQPWLARTPLSGLVARLVAKRVAKPAYNDPNDGLQRIVLDEFPHGYYLLLDDNDGPQWFRARDVPAYFCLTDTADGAIVQAELQRAHERVRARREWVWRSTQSLVWHALGRALGLPRDISNLIAKWALLLPTDEQRAVEPHCEDCDVYRGLTAAECEGPCKCDTCQRPICFDDNACAIEGHSATHRHVSRMLPAPFECGDDDDDDNDDDDDQ